jgi:hypothetical protein
MTTLLETQQERDRVARMVAAMVTIVWEVLGANDMLYGENDELTTDVASVETTLEQIVAMLKFANDGEKKICLYAASYQLLKEFEMIEPETEPVKMPQKPKRG